MNLSTFIVASLLFLAVFAILYFQIKKSKTGGNGCGCGCSGCAHACHSASAPQKRTSKSS